MEFNDVLCSTDLYQPLQKYLQAFRLLTILPGEPDDPVRCLLKRSSLDHEIRPRFETISYCWGNARLRGCLTINGRLANVPSSSAAAVKRVRLRTGSRIIWIDAICINQCDTRERSEQVALMGLIYRSAVGNLIYLGKAPRDSARVLDILWEIVGDAMELQPPGEQMNIRSLKSALADDYGSHALSTVFHSSDEELATSSFASWSIRWDRGPAAVTEGRPSVLSNASRAGKRWQSPNDKTPYRLQIADYADPGILTIKGFLVGRISRATLSSARTSMDAAAVRGLVNFASASVRDAWAFAPIPNETLDTMTSELLTMGSCGPVPLFTSPRDKTAAFLDFVIHLRDTGSLPCVHEGGRDPAAAGRLSRFYTEVILSTKDRCFFSVDIGHFGMGPSITREGDVVAVFLGSIHPSVLRPVGDQYRVVGAAYIPGLMEGEVFHMELEETWIDLR